MVKRMFVKFILPFSFMIVLLCSGPVMADKAAYNYISPDKVKSMLESEEAMTLLDIQTEEEYSRHHIKGSLATYAYPVKSREEKTKLERILPELTSSEQPVVIVCPRGGGGAKRTYDYLASRGVEKKRMFILEKGQSGWPYDQLVESK